MTAEQIKLLIAMTENMREVKKSILQFFAGVTDENFEEYKELFKQIPNELCEDGSYYPALPKFSKKYGEISWYDDFYVERYQVVYVCDLLDNEMFFDSEEKKDDFIRECMETGYLSFEYDW